MTSLSAADALNVTPQKTIEAGWSCLFAGCHF